MSEVSKTKFVEAKRRLDAIQPGLGHLFDVAVRQAMEAGLIAGLERAALWHELRAEKERCLHACPEAAGPIPAPYAPENWRRDERDAEDIRRIVADLVRDPMTGIEWEGA